MKRRPGKKERRSRFSALLDGLTPVERVISDSARVRRPRFSTARIHRVVDSHDIVSQRHAVTPTQRVTRIAAMGSNGYGGYVEFNAVT